MRASADEASVNIHMRVPKRTRDLIDLAAQVARKTRTEFMLEIASRAAEDTLLDQRNFFLDEGQYQDFLKELEGPVKPNAALKALLAKRPPWER